MMRQFSGHQNILVSYYASSHSAVVDASSAGDDWGDDDHHHSGSKSDKGHPWKIRTSRE